VTSFEKAQLNHADAVRRAKLEKTPESYRALAETTQEKRKGSSQWAAVQLAPVENSVQRQAANEYGLQDPPLGRPHADTMATSGAWSRRTDTSSG